MDRTKARRNSDIGQFDEGVGAGQLWIRPSVSLGDLGSLVNADPGRVPTIRPQSRQQVNQ